MNWLDLIKVDVLKSVKSLIPTATTAAIPLAPVAKTSLAPAPVPAPSVAAVVAAVPGAPFVSAGIRADHLAKMGASQANADKYAAPLNAACARFQINTNARICGFIAQIFEESANLSATSENLNYRADTLCRLWPGRFPTLQAAQAVVSQGPEGIANAIYGNRLGNTAPGDGYKYRGRGLIQLTFKGNYGACAEGTALDLVNHPELLDQPANAALSAAWFWSSHGCNHMADLDSVDGVTQASKRINGGTNGLDTRIANWHRAKTVFADIK